MTPHQIPVRAATMARDVRQETRASTWQLPVGPTKDTVPGFMPAGCSACSRQTADICTGAAQSFQHLQASRLASSTSGPTACRRSSSTTYKGRHRLTGTDEAESLERMAGYGDDGVDLTELTLGPPGVNARKARRARKSGQQPLSSSAMYVVSSPRSCRISRG